MLAHAEVVVRAPDHDGAGADRGMPYCVREAPSDPLEIGKHAVAPFLVQAGKRGGKEMIIGHSAKSPSGLCSTIGDSVRRSGRFQADATDLVDIRIGERRVADIRTMICLRKSLRKGLVETCSNYPESCDRDACR